MSWGEKVFFWLPRVLSILFILFLSLFALDVFGAYQGWATIAALFIHLIPSFILAGAVAIAWRYELFGALVFIGFALWYVWAAGFDRPWSWYAFIALPPAITGLLYIVSWMQKMHRERKALAVPVPEKPATQSE